METGDAAAEVINLSITLIIPSLPGRLTPDEEDPIITAQEII
jgi:hypothetical protein